MQHSSIFSGWVMHRRLRPARHAFKYRGWWLLLDLDEIDALDRTLRLFSRGRWNVLSFYDRDFGHDGSDLRQQIAQALRERGIAFDGGPIRLLCMPRILGYQFNPLSVYFCYRQSGALAAVVYEVHNTFGERHSYCLEAVPGEGGAVRQRSDKQFHVSPFLGMAMDYDFRLSPPDETLSVAISASEHGRPLLHALLKAERQELSDGGLLRLLVTYPLVTWKVISAIHVEAFRLWRKGLTIYPHPPAPTPPSHGTKPFERTHA